MLRFNKNYLEDKVYACWLGKNIGGTLGTPYEGSREINDIKGFSSPEGKALPNDDLDLQLIWLKALEDRGPKNITAQVLGEYWLNYITPHWNEYGIGKCNMRAGLLPPLSGEYNNYWKNSNGAWIRSEIWACVAPGCPDTAIKYAMEDACVDHGMGEGTNAEIFTAAMQSAAFVVNDPKKLIDIGLSKIPNNSRVARSIKKVVKAFDKGTDWQTVRNEIIQDSVDIGWFQAPANLAFVIIGLLYGKGNFKNSLITAVNCGDDTDCTGATLGALLGIMHGSACIPEDWKSFIGDDIVTIAIDRGSWWGVPKTCKELTERVLNFQYSVLQANNAKVILGDGDNDFREATMEKLTDRRTAKDLLSRPANSFTVDFIYASATVEFYETPNIVPLGELKLRVTFNNQMPDPKHLNLRWLLPGGWRVTGGTKDVYLDHQGSVMQNNFNFIEVTVTAGEQINAQNRLILEAACPGRPTVGLIPITILG